MPRFVRRVLSISLLLAAWALVGKDRAPVPILLADAVAGPAAMASGSGSENDAADPESVNAPPRSGTEHPPHDLANPKVFTKVILYIKDNYVDANRVKPKEMMVASLEYVEKTVPDLIVEGSAESGKLKITVNNKAQTFDISHVDSLWKMSFTMKDIFRFIADNMRPMDDTRDVEYAAINGMLSKLDPHSVLLRPELYREMKLTTKGEFGGLGFVIQMKEGNLTVVKVLPKTPAYRAGIKKDDQIKKIGEESTVNMDLNEAVSKLRGVVGSKVTITVERKAWEKPQVMTLTRDTISIESVQSKLLAKNVGYVRLKNFQGNTTRDLMAALNELQKQAEPTGGVKGLVLDLRGNPGGLLEQAIQVSDLFLSQGTIVATVGSPSSNYREEKRAHPDEYDDAYPVAVLVNSGSASASEIVAGALKNLDRAVIIGRQTFGKGSVQVLYDFPDDSALKLTIAKYLTPGDVSIQEVGIIPDIGLVPTRVTPERVDVFAPRKSIGEADLDSHFNNPNGPAATKRDDVLGRGKPVYELKYLKETAKVADVAAKEPKEPKEKEGKDAKDSKTAHATPVTGDKDPLLDVQGVDENLDDQLDAEAQDEIKEDFEVQFARDFVLAAPSTDRKKMIELGKQFVTQKRGEQEEKINAAIASLGVDWSPGATPANPQLVATLKPGPDSATKAGDLLELAVTVENKGTEAVKRVRAWTDSENAYLDRREFVFGALAPGESRTWKIPVRLPKDLLSRRDSVTLKLMDDSGNLGEPVVSELNFVELPRPNFAFNWQVVDSCEACNHDGLIQRGETVDLVVDVTNTGNGPALETFSQIKNAADENIFIDKGRFQLGDLAPNETKTARFTLEVKKAYSQDTFPLKFAILDEPLEEFTSEKLELPIAQENAQVEDHKAVVKLSEKAQLLAAPASDARVIAELPKGGTFSADGKVAGFYKINLAKDRFAFVSAQDVKETRGKAPALKDMPKDVSFVAARIPPKISLNVDPAQGGTVAEGDRFTLSGKVSGARRNLDLYVLVNDQKVFFKSVTAAPIPGDPQAKPAAEFQFTTDFPLKEGNNNVMVVARESQDFASRKSVVIRRRPASWAQQVSPSAPEGKVSTP